MISGMLERILYVEDEPDIRAVAKIALETVGGFMLNTCNCGAQALQDAEGFKPDLLLLDVMMPGLDGPSTLAGLRKLPQTASTPAVFMTAKVQAAEMAHYASLGVIGVIAKPFNPMTLAKELRELWTNAALPDQAE